MIGRPSTQYDRVKMRGKYLGPSNSLECINGKIYDIVDIQPLCGDDMYAVIDETGEAYLYDPDMFEIVEDLR